MSDNIDLRAKHLLYEKELEEVAKRFETKENIDYDYTFKANLPDSLNYNHYELKEEYGGTANGWREYLRDNQAFINSELAAIAEPAARAALARLGDARGNEVSALKAILENSKMINEAQKQQVKILITFMPPKERTPRSKSEEGEKLDV